MVCGTFLRVKLEALQTAQVTKNMSYFKDSFKKTVKLQIDVFRVYIYHYCYVFIPRLTEVSLIDVKQVGATATYVPNSRIEFLSFSTHDHIFISIFNSCIFKQNVQFFEFLLNSRPFLEQKQIRNNNNSYNYHKRRGNYCCTL